MPRNKKYIRWPYLVLLGLLVSCSKNSPAPVSPGTPFTPPVTSSSFAKGADVGWLTQMEASGYKFYNSSGTQEDCLQILKEKGMNAIRLRVWVNPAAGWNNAKDVVAKAKRAQALGMKVMIDFHYSDTWADPGNQTKPAAWSGYSVADLSTAVYNHTYHVLDTLKTNGVIPVWVQVGNEITGGMLWPDGQAPAHFQNLTQFINSGYEAVKAVDGSIKVVIHLENAWKNSTYRYFFDSLTARSAKYDVIGMSAYPLYGPAGASWQDYNNLVLTNMNDMVSRYGKSVMICETGMDYTQAATAKLFLADLITKTNALADGKGLGVFYWEPEAYNWQGYTLGAFDLSGKPTEALDAF